MSDYTPTTEDILRGFTAPQYKMHPRQPEESMSAYLSRLSIESLQGQMESEATARRWLAAHDAEVAAKALDDAANVAANEIVRCSEIVVVSGCYIRREPYGIRYWDDARTMLVDRAAAIRSTVKTGDQT